MQTSVIALMVTVFHIIINVWKSKLSYLLTSRVVVNPLSGKWVNELTHRVVIEPFTAKLVGIGFISKY